MNSRESARAVVVGPLRRILLLEYEDAVPVDPSMPDVLRYWVTPGGGLEQGESFEDAIRRELREEAAITEVEIAKWVWVREKELVLPGLGACRSHERYFLCRVTDETISHEGLTESERLVFRSCRWWSIEELRTSTETFRPPSLVELIEPLLAGQLPSSPVVIPQ